MQSLITYLADKIYRYNLVPIPVEAERIPTPNRIRKDVAEYECNYRDDYYGDRVCRIKSQR